MTSGRETESPPPAMRYKTTDDVEISMNALQMNLDYALDEDLEEASPRQLKSQVTLSKFSSIYFPYLEIHHI